MQKKFRNLRKRYGISRRRQIRRLKLFGKHPWIVPAVTVLGLGLISLGIFLVVSHRSVPVVTARVVIVSHDHQQQVVPSREPTVGALLKKMAITLHPGDVVEPAANTPIDQDQFRINIYRAVPVQIVDNGSVTYTYSAATTARSIAQQASITTYPEDKVTMQPVSNFVTQHAIGQQVTIDRAVPVMVNLYGSQLMLRTQAKTVGELLKEKNIKLAADDQVLPAVSQSLTPNMQIFIVRNGTKLISETQPIAMPVQVINDPTLAYGTSAIRQQGSSGQQVVTYQINLKNGQEVSRTAIQTVVTVNPVTEIEVIGTNLGGIRGDMALAGIPPGDYTYVDYIVSHESGWNPSARNASGAYGLCQALPGSKMASAGSDWATNPITQLSWCDGYANGHYGGWAAAYNYWVSHRYW